MDVTVGTAPSAGGRSAPLSGRARGLDRWDWLALVLLAALLATTALHHELGHDEAQAWNIARGSGTLGELLHHSRLEGHTPLWFAVLWPASYSGEPWTMQLIAIALTLFVSVLLLRDRPFGRTICLLLLAGYYITYEYSIVARPYILTLAFSAALASLLFRDPRRDPLLPVLLCALIAFTSAYSALLSLALLIATLGTTSGGKVPSGTARVRFALALALYGLFLAVSIWLIVTPMRPEGIERAIVEGERAGRFSVLRTLNTPVLPHADRLPLDIGNWLGTTLPGRLLAGFATLVTLLAVGTLLWRRGALLLGWIAAIVLIVVGAHVSGLVSERHLGHLFIAALVLCWIAAGPSARGQAASREAALPHVSLAVAVLCGVLLYHAAIAAAVIVFDLRFALTPAKRVAAAIEAAVDEPYVLLTDYSYNLGATFAYLDRPVYDIRCQCTTRHFEWDWKRQPGDMTEALAEAWCKLAATRDERIVLALKEGVIDESESLVPLATVPGGRRDRERSPVRVWTPSDEALRACSSS